LEERPELDLKVVVVGKYSIVNLLKVETLTLNNKNRNIISENEQENIEIRYQRENQLANKKMNSNLIQQRAYLREDSWVG
jgi:hypothetical protein